MKCRVYLDELEEVSTKLINYSLKDINNKIEELRLLIDEMEWEGIAHEAFTRGYNTRITKIKNMNNKLKLFGDYLKFCKEHFGETQEKLVKSWNEYLDELKVKKNELHER